MEEDIDSLEDLMKSWNCNTEEDEYKLLLEGCYAKWDDTNHENNVDLVDKAEQRYKRYIRLINMEEYEYIENMIYKFLYTKKCCDEESFNLMKKIDKTVVDTIAKGQKKSKRE